MRVSLSGILILSITIFFCLGCNPEPDEVPDVTSHSPVAGIKRRIPSTPVPVFTLYCQSRPKTGNDPSIVLVQNGKETLVTGDLRDINMQNVQKINVLKSAAAVKRFGKPFTRSVLVIYIK